MPDREATIRQKSERLEAARAKVQRFVEGGGYLKSRDGVPLGLELIRAFTDLAEEFRDEARAEGAAAEGEVASPSMQELLRLFAFTKKSELEKYCRDVVINQRDFVDFIVACEMGQTPFLHLIHYGDHAPQQAQLADEDLAALARNPVGPLEPAAQKTVRKIGHLFNVRRYLVGHIFYVPDLSEWHFFQFDQRDLENTRPNHWKEGAHVHFINWLWPNHDARTLWENFISGKVKLSDSLHVRFRSQPGVRAARESTNAGRSE